jgi:thiamine thiazole synthase
MSLDERIITEAILETYAAKFKSMPRPRRGHCRRGPSGLTAARLLAKDGFNVALFERKLSLGGGMWGGGMTWNSIVVQEESVHLLTDVGIQVTRFRDNYFTADAVAATTTLASAACLAGTKVFNCLTVEDVVLREKDGIKRVTGLVINSSPVEMAGLHVDPVVVGCKYLIEATGHPVEVLKTLVAKTT